MRNALPLLLLPLAAACGQDESGLPVAENRGTMRTPAVPTKAEGTMASAPPAGAPAAGARDAAGVLRRYYDLIEAGQYRDAWAMRGGKPADAAAFAANFAAYRRYKVTLGKPSDPVSQEGWLFVEVPIQIFGALKNGTPFGSAGSVTLRRAESVPGATLRQRDWHIYTG
ncbi:MAG TPA: hypothetical protein VEZ70_01725 [Allosphingosinicella sp.]|nr:hypothetical protein [Allosphingosinicella sp.]